MSNECRDCYSGCPDPNFDRCIRYTGENVEELDICNGDWLDKVLTNLIEKVFSFSDGTTIIPEVDTTCVFFSSILGTSSPTLVEILQALITGECDLNTSIATLSDSVNSSYSFNTSCLSVASTATRDDILQATITKTCSIDGRLTLVENDYVKATELNSLIEQYIESNTTTVTQQYTKFSPYIAYEYYGPLTVFDGSGKGLSSAGYDKVFLCNGSNGTPDKRGRVAVGVNVGVPGSAMDAAVDPAVPGNYQVSLKTKLGAFKHLLSLTESPAHSHTISESEHFHYTWSHGTSTGSLVSSSTVAQSEAASGGNSSYYIYGGTNVANAGKTSPAKGIPVAAPAGGSQSHNNTQPSIGANYIMYLP